MSWTATCAYCEVEWKSDGKHVQAVDLDSKGNGKAQSEICYECCRKGLKWTGPAKTVPKPKPEMYRLTQEQLQKLYAAHKQNPKKFKEQTIKTKEVLNRSSTPSVLVTELMQLAGAHDDAKIATRKLQKKQEVVMEPHVWNDLKSRLGTKLAEQVLQRYVNIVA